MFICLSIFLFGVLNPFCAILIILFISSYRIPKFSYIFIRWWFFSIGFVYLSISIYNFFLVNFVSVVLFIKSILFLISLLALCFRWTRCLTIFYNWHGIFFLTFIFYDVSFLTLACFSFLFLLKTLSITEILVRKIRISFSISLLHNEDLYLFDGLTFSFLGLNWCFNYGFVYAV